MSRTIKVWGVVNQQVVLVAASPAPLTQEFVYQLQEDMKERVNQFVPEHPKHMSTILLGVVVTDQPVPEEVRSSNRSPPPYSVGFRLFYGSFLAAFLSAWYMITRPYSFNPP